MEYSGAMDVISKWFNGITENKVAQAGGRRHGQHGLYQITSSRFGRCRA
jgi:hypothetical protein